VIGCEAAMSLELILGGLISIGMLVYLVFALLRPEKF
jgi:K+-transporting ATPase KdpF subunit